MSYKKQNLAALIKGAQRGEQKSLEELIRRVQKNIFTMFSYLTEERQDTADLTQEVLIKTAKNIKNLRNTENFKPWLNQIAANTFCDYVRKSAHEKNTDFETDKVLEIKDKIGCEPGEKCLFSEMEKLIKAALLNLPETLRIAIVLREYEGLSYEDIAKITNTALGTVKSRIARARWKLRRDLADFL